MSRVDCGQLLAELDALVTHGVTGRREVVAHLEECQSCRHLALSRDPSLLFVLAGQVPPAVDLGNEAEKMKARVHLARRARRAEGATPTRDARSRTLRSLASLAAVVTAALMLHPEAPEGEAPIAIPAASRPSWEMVDGAWAASLNEMPLVEDVEFAPEQVLEWSDSEISVVLLVDARLDV